jgi:hypothetical protein
VVSNSSGAAADEEEERAGEGWNELLRGEVRDAKLLCAPTGSNAAV